MTSLTDEVRRTGIDFLRALLAWLENKECKDEAQDDQIKDLKRRVPSGRPKKQS